MRATLTAANRIPNHRRRLPTSPCYLLSHEDGEGLNWTASAKREWRHTDGRPAVETIAEAAGVDWRNVFKLRANPTTPPSNPTMARLEKISASAHKVTRATARARLFWFFDPEDADDIARLTGYLNDRNELTLDSASAA